MSEGHSAELTNTHMTYGGLGKDADFLYALLISILKMPDANRQDLIEMWQVIKKDRQQTVHMLKEALEKEIHG